MRTYYKTNKSTKEKRQDCKQTFESIEGEYNDELMKYEHSISNI